MKRYKSLFKEDFYLDKWEATHTDKKIKKGDIFPFFYKKKISDFIVVDVEDYDNKGWWGIPKDSIDYIITIKMKKGGKVLFQIPVQKDGRIWGNMKQITVLDYAWKDKQFMSLEGHK